MKRINISEAETKQKKLNSSIIGYQEYKSMNIAYQDVNYFNIRYQTIGFYRIYQESIHVHVCVCDNNNEHKETGIIKIPGNRS